MPLLSSLGFVILIAIRSHVTLKQYMPDHLGRGTNHLSFLVHGIENIAICGLAEPGFFSLLFIVEAIGQSFRSKIPCVTEWFVDT